MRERVVWNSYNPIRVWVWKNPYWQELLAAVIVGFVVAWMIA